MAPKRPRIVVVEWHDAHSDALKVISAEEPAPHHPWAMQTTGWLIHDDEVGITLAHETYDEDDAASWRGYTFIPRGMVVSVKAPNSRTRRKKVVDA